MQIVDVLKEWRIVMIFFKRKIVYLIKLIMILYLFNACSSDVLDVDNTTNITGNTKPEIETTQNETNDKPNDKPASNSHESYQIDLQMNLVDNVRFGIGSEGGEKLEDGVTFLFAVFNESNREEISWLKSWNNIEISELDYYSGVSVLNQNLLMAIDGTLYSLFIKTGEVDWQLDHIGYPSKPPIIDESGRIYLVCERKPYITIINNNGTIESRLNSDQLYGIQDLYFENGLMIAKIIADTYSEIKIENVDDFID